MQEPHKEIINLQRKFRDWRDDANHPLIRQLDRDIQRIEDDMQTNKNPRSVEDQVKRVLMSLKSLDGTGAMSNGHIDELHDRFETLRDSLRKLM